MIIRLSRGCYLCNQDNDVSILLSDSYCGDGQDGKVREGGDGGGRG